MGGHNSLMSIILQWLKDDLAIAQENLKMPTVAPSIGQKGLFQAWKSSDPLTSATVSAHPDAGFLSLTNANGKIIHFDPNTGLVSGERDSAGAEERVTFDGKNILLSRPGTGQVGVFAWFNV